MKPATNRARRQVGPAAGRVRFVLVEPSGPRNVGAAARAMKNLGFRRLTLVSPRCDPLEEEARKMAMDARDLLESARVEEDLDAALDGAATVVGTSRRTGKQRKPHWRLDALAPELASLARAGEVAMVFGREVSGLTDEELDRCTHLARLPASEEFPSFNLAQAVLLAAYELHRALVAGPPEPALEPPAPHREREAMYRHLEHALRRIGFLRGDAAASMMRRIRRMFGRAGLSEGEVRILRGIAHQVEWAAGRAGLPERPEDGEG